MTDEEVAEVRKGYKAKLEALFFPEDPAKNDIINYFASLLRVVGMEDRGWDPYLESRGVLDDLNHLFNMELPGDLFPERGLTTWRLGLLFYSHIVEMDAPYEVLTNLLRFRLGKGYSPNPYFALLTPKEQKNYRKRGIYSSRKIQIIKELSNETGLDIGSVFDDFYDGDLRNAISHSDYTLTEDEFRCRRGTGAVGAYKIPLEEVNITITKAKTFFSTFFEIEQAARIYWGTYKQRAVPYDPVYKGMLEVLVDEHDLMCGFKVHWPNNSESIYRRTRNGVDMINCTLDFKNASIRLFVDLYARNPGKFSPLVEQDQEPKYTALDGSEARPVWRPEAQ